MVDTCTPPRIECWLLAAQLGAGAGFALAWLRGAGSGGWTAAGVALVAAGLGLAVAGGLALGSSFRITPSPRPGARLVRRGVYRWLRHPMYLAVVLVLGGATCLRPDGAVLLLGGINLVLYLGKAWYEEGRLLAHYPEYARYREGTLGVRPRRRRDRG